MLVSLCVLALSACAGTAPASPSASATSKPAGSVAPAASSTSAGKPAGSAAASGLTPVKVAFSQVTAGSAPTYVAMDQGFFAKHGLDVSIVQVAGPQEVPALTADDIQIGAVGGNELVDADLAGASLVMVASSSNYPLFSLNAAKSIAEPKQLAGKTIGITSAGSSSEAVAKIFLHHFGLDGQAKLQPSGQIQAVLAGLENGTLTSAVLSPPSTELAAKQGFPELINGPTLGEPMVHGGMAVTRDYLKAHPDIVKEALQGYLEGWQFLADPANEAASVQSLVKWTKTDQNVAEESYKYIYPVWSGSKTPRIDPKAIANILDVVSTNPKAKSAKPEDFIANSILNSIAK